jgi:hypothetical protein
MRSCGFATLGKHSKTRGVPILPDFEVPIGPIRISAYAVPCLWANISGRMWILLGNGIHLVHFPVTIGEPGLTKGTSPGGAQYPPGLTDFRDFGRIIT